MTKETQHCYYVTDGDNIIKFSINTANCRRLNELAGTVDSKAGQRFSHRLLPLSSRKKDS